MDALQQAIEMAEWANSGKVSNDVQDYYIRMAQAYAAIAQAKQLKRMADASERQAAAVERRNELLEEYNKLSHEQHVIYRSEVLDFLSRFFQAVESDK